MQLKEVDQLIDALIEAKINNDQKSIEEIITTLNNKGAMLQELEHGTVYRLATEIIAKEPTTFK